MSYNQHGGLLSPAQTLQLHLTWCYRGIRDASQWKSVYNLTTSDAEVRANVMKCVLLNTLSLVFIHFFDMFLHPMVKDHEVHGRNFGMAYQVLWIAPVVGASVYLNTLWSSVIARRTYTVLHGSRAAANLEFSPVTSASLTGSARVAFVYSVLASAYRGVMVSTSVFLDIVLRYIPWIGGGLSMIFLCWVNSYYFFESEWLGRGLNLPRRVQHLEERWAYYLGYGLPTAILCSFASGLTSPALFALVYPPVTNACLRATRTLNAVYQFIIMAMYAHPAPLDPYNPISFESAVSPAPSVPVRLPVFAAVLWLNDTAIMGVEVLMRMLGMQFDASPFVAGTYRASGRTISGARAVKREVASEDGLAFGYSGSMDAYGSGMVPLGSTAASAHARFRVPGPDASRRKYQ